jgi:hypothetical protein
MRMQESTKLATKFSLNPDPRTLTPKLQASIRMTRNTLRLTGTVRPTSFGSEMGLVQSR